MPQSSRKCAGSALVELLISVLLMAIAVSSLMGSLLQGSGQAGHLQRKEQAGMQSGSVLQALKNYVTPVPDATTQTNAPNASNGHPCWNFLQKNPDGSFACPATCPNNCETNNTCTTDCWALAPGNHDITNLYFAPNVPIVDPNSQLAQHGGTVKYTVDAAGNVSMSVNWNE